MFEESLIPLLLSDILGRLRGKTRFQKLVYIVQNEAIAKKVRGPSFNYELYHYGPFSSELSSVLENLKNRGFLDEEIEITPSGYERYVYSTTEKGRTLLKRSRGKRLLSKKLENIVSVVANEYGDLPLPQLIEEAYRRYQP